MKLRALTVSLRVISYFMLKGAETAFVEIGGIKRCSSKQNSEISICLPLHSVNNNEKAKIYEELDLEIRAITQQLWSGETIPTLSSPSSSPLANYRKVTAIEGEAQLPTRTGDAEIVIPISDRAEFFKKEALLKGCPKAQHSYGLLLWSGFAGLGGHVDPEASVKFHAAAAYQNHLDGMAILGGCLRTGSGIKQNSALGLKLIDYCASMGNPTGVNKKAALCEAVGDDFQSVRLYEECLAIESGSRVNALLLFNLGWCYINGRGVDQKDVSRGVSLWKEAVIMSPDEGSEEAAWHLYEMYKRDDPQEAMRWLSIADELGYT